MNHIEFVVTSVIVILISEIASFLLNNEFLPIERIGCILLGLAIGHAIWVVLHLKPRKKDNKHDNTI